MLPTNERIRPIDVGRSPTRSSRKRAVGLAEDARRGQERLELLADRDRPGAGTAAAVRRRERLVRVDVHDVEAGLAGLEPAEDGVEVRAVHVGERADGVDGLEQLADRATRTGPASTGS